MSEFDGYPKDAMVIEIKNGLVSVAHNPSEKVISVRDYDVDGYDETKLLYDKDNQPYNEFDIG